MGGNDDKAQGTVDQAKGRAKEAWGSVTGDENTKAEGQSDQAKGKVEKSVGDVKNTVNDLTS